MFLMEMLKDLPICLMMRNKKSRAIELSAMASIMKKNIKKVDFFLPRNESSDPNEIHWLRPRFCMMLEYTQEIKYKAGYMMIFDALRTSFHLKGTGEDEEQFSKDLIEFCRDCGGVLSYANAMFSLEEWTTDFQGGFVPKD